MLLLSPPSNSESAGVSVEPAILRASVRKVSSTPAPVFALVLKVGPSLPGELLDRGVLDVPLVHEVRFVEHCSSPTATIFLSTFTPTEPVTSPFPG
jgi:hypothetical protein